MRPARHADEISRFNLNREDRPPWRADVKEAAPLHDEPHLVFVVPVLAAEPGEHRVQARSIGPDVDDVGRRVTAARLELIDLVRIGCQNLVRGRRRRHLTLGFPTLVGNAVRLKKTRDGFWVRQRSLLFGDSYQCHGFLRRQSLRSFATGPMLRTEIPESRHDVLPGQDRRPKCLPRAAAAERRAPLEVAGASSPPDGRGAPYSGRFPKSAATRRARGWSRLRGP